VAKLAKVVRVLFGALLILHGIMQVLPGAKVVDAAVGWAAGTDPGNPITFASAALLLALSACGLGSGGLGILGLQPFGRAWSALAATGAGASLLFFLTGHGGG
jgi:hypothetical protein